MNTINELQSPTKSQMELFPSAQQLSLFPKEKAQKEQQPFMTVSEKEADNKDKEGLPYWHR